MNRQYITPQATIFALSQRDMLMASDPKISVHKDPSDEQASTTDVLSRHNYSVWDDEEEDEGI